MERDLADAHERQLVEGARRQPEELRELYHHYFPRIYAYVASHTERSSDAEDLVSLIFLRVIEEISHFEYRGAGAFAAWVFRIARNVVIDFQRQQRRRGLALSVDIIAHHPAGGPNLVDVILQEEVAVLLRSSIAGLSPRRREVIRLKFFGGLRNREIAAILQLKERSVASHLSRALNDLALALSDAEIVSSSAAGASAGILPVGQGRPANSAAAAGNWNGSARFVQPAGRRPSNWWPTPVRGLDPTYPTAADPNSTPARRVLLDALEVALAEAVIGDDSRVASRTAASFEQLGHRAPRVFEERLETRLLERFRDLGGRSLG